MASVSVMMPYVQTVYQCGGDNSAVSLLQVFESLESLEKIMDNVFTRINQRISTEKNQLSNLSNRVNSAVRKISNLSYNSNHSIVAFSPEKMPPVNVHDSKPLFDIAPTSIPKKHKVSIDTTMLSSNAPIPAPTIEAEVKSSFYETRLSKINSRVGLGKPRGITSVSSLLVFNTNKNAYQAAENVENLDDLFGRVNGNMVEVAKKSDLPPAPVDLLGNVERPPGFNDEYEPIQQNAVRFSLPDNLPTLNNLALDVYYIKNTISSGIYPSKAPPLPPIPEIVEHKSEVNVPLPVVAEVNNVITAVLPGLEVNDATVFNDDIEESDNESPEKDLISDAIGIGSIDSSQSITDIDLEVKKASLRPVSDRPSRDIPAPPVPNGFTFNAELLNFAAKLLERRKRIDGEGGDF